MLFSEGYNKFLLEVENNYENIVNTRSEYSTNRDIYYLNIYELVEELPVIYFDDSFIDFFSLIYLLSELKFEKEETYFYLLKFYLYNYSIFKLKTLAERFFDTNNNFYTILTATDHDFLIKDFFSNLILIRANSYLVYIKNNLVVLDFVLSKMDNFSEFLDYRGLDYSDYENIYSDDYIEELKKSFNRITDENSFNFYLKKLYAE